MSDFRGDILQMTLAGLETGLCVWHIATVDPHCCDADTEIGSVLNDPRMEPFDRFPVRDNGVIIGYIERAAHLNGAVREHMRPLDESLLISAEEPLTRFIPLMANTSFRLVVKAAAIRGIVTRSDLQKLPVRLFVFSLVTHLEMVMGTAIQTLYGDGSDWLALLSEGRRGQIEQKQKLLQQRNLDPPLIELTDFCDKRDILTRRLRLGGDFVRELKDIEGLRNAIAHAAAYARSPEEVQQFVECLQHAQQWIRHLTDGSVATTT